MIRFISPKKLRALGIVGMNQRNIDFIGRNNPRKNYPIVDDKLLTKAAAIKHQLPAPELYGVIDHQFQVKTLIEKHLAGRESFVLKPVHGSGGKGILVITRVENG